MLLRPRSGLVYWNAFIYRLAMRLLEGRERRERLARIVAAIPPGSEVIDLCCGPAEIARDLDANGCRYVGLDVNRRFVHSGRRRGIDVRYWNGESMEIPRGDVVCMLSSLYHFIPRQQELFERMLASARMLVVVSEPVHNWASSKSPLVRALALSLTRVSGRSFPDRLDERALRALVASIPPDRVQFTQSGREFLLLVSTRP